MRLFYEYEQQKRYRGPKTNFPGEGGLMKLLRHWTVGFVAL